MRRAGGDGRPPARPARARRLGIGAGLLAAAAALVWLGTGAPPAGSAGSPGAPAGPGAPPGHPAATPEAGGLAVATFAGGCFWCMEPPFDELDGVVATISGYTGGPEERPTYQQVASGRTGHAEAVQIRYDPTRVRYEELLRTFWRHVDPLTADRQFCDAGRQYRSAIFYANEEEQRLALASRDAVAARFDEPVVTEIVPAGPFWPAEESHQDYARKNPIRYHVYRTGCGRDRRLRELWGEGGPVGGAGAERR